MEDPARPPRLGASLRGAAPLALLAFAAVSGILQVRSVDVFWHLATGRWMIAHRALPRLDPFRFTSVRVPWVDHEWGFQLLAELAEKAGGLPALVVGRALVFIALAALLLVGLGRRRAPPAAAAAIALTALLGIRGRLLLRPELATLVGFLVLLLLLGAFRARGGWRRVVAIAALVAVWANLHPGVLVAPAVAGAYLLGAHLDGRRGRGRPIPWREVVGVPALAAAAILANPWGPEVYLVPLRISQALAGLPATNPDWAPLWERPPLLLGLALAALLGLLFRSRRRGGRIDLALGLVVLATLALTLTGARHQGLLWLAAALLAGSTLESRGGVAGEGPGPTPGGGRRATALAVAACLAATLWCLLPAGFPLAPRYGAGFGIAPGRFPAGAVAELARWEPVGNLLNGVVYGGYLLWRLYPPRQVFYDTRNEVNPELLREMARARTGSAPWEALLDRYAIDGALVGYETGLTPAVTPAAEPGGEATVEYRTPSALLFPPERFALVYWDDLSMLFLARRPARQARLAAAEYRLVQPEDWAFTLRRAAAHPKLRRGMVAEVERKLRQDPACGRAAALLAQLRAMESAALAPP
jgi:hypothetical protein